tara:strand:+ start:84784 stop:85938 length:1155 start_codon:yes stop_codon:yes gene_type:complete
MELRSKRDSSQNAVSTDIVHVTGSLGGGVLTSIRLLCNYFASNGFSVALVYSARDELYEGWEESFAESIQLIPLEISREANFGQDIANLSFLTKLFSELQPKVVHLHSAKAGFTGRLAMRLSSADAAVFYSPRGWSFLQEDRSAVGRFIYLQLEKLGACLSGKVIACSQTEFDVCVEQVSKNAVLIENGIDVCAVPTRIPNSLEGESRARLIGTVGRISPQKNPAAFLGVVKEFVGKNVKFVWIGDSFGADDQNDKVQLLAAGVEVTGWLPRDEVLQRVSTFDVFLLMSKWEGMPLALIESQVSGVVGVVSNIVGNKDIVSHGETGFIVNSSGEASAAIRQLVGNAELLESMSLSARAESINRFSSERLGSEYSVVYGLADSEG